jgi:hypothetical protein
MIKVQVMRILSFILIFLLFNNTSFSQVDCEDFYLLNRGKSISMSIIDLVKGDVGQLILKVQSTSNLSSSKKSTVHNIIIDSKKNIVANSELTTICDGKQLGVDIRFLLNCQQVYQFSQTPISKELIIYYPNQILVGSELEPAQFSINYISNEKVNVHFDVAVINRQVLNQEIFKCKAGTWLCFVIQSRIVLKTTIDGITIPMIIESKEWFAPGFGLVKIENKSRRTEINAIL